MDAVLETDRLTFRRFTVEDADLLVELDSDPAVMRYLTGGQPTPAELIRTGDLPGILAGYERWDGRFGVFAAQEKDSGAFIGWMHLRPEVGRPVEELELGYRLRQPAWGHGYATEGSRALLERAFTTPGVRVVWAETMAMNRASQAVMKKVGMRVTDAIPTPPDMLMVEGSEQGGFRYEITKAQWVQR
jgi:RimJ/RimL family protein N-acetyltransferase